DPRGRPGCEGSAGPKEMVRIDGLSGPGDRVGLFDHARRAGESVRWLERSSGPASDPRPASMAARMSLSLNPEESDDAGLAVRARAGDRDAFAELYRRFAGTVHGVLLAAVPREEARDLVQEVFLLALRAIERLEDPERVGPWLCTIARNRAKD